MSIAKRLLEEKEGKEQTALQIAFEAGVLTECKVHGYTIGGDSDVEEAYKLGNSKFDSDLKSVFMNRREMTDTIKSVVEDNWGDCCGCEKQRDE